jgi:hypothetical protein
LSWLLVVVSITGRRRSISGIGHRWCRDDGAAGAIGLGRSYGAWGKGREGIVARLAGIASWLGSIGGWRRTSRKRGGSLFETWRGWIGHDEWTVHKERRLSCVCRVATARTYLQDLTDMTVNLPGVTPEVPIAWLG